LVTVAKLASPIAPFYSDLLFRDLNTITGKETAESVHLTNYPEYQSYQRDEDLEKSISFAQTVCSLAHSIRKNKKLRVRLPLKEILIASDENFFQENISKVRDLILSETNIKELSFVNALGQVTMKAKPNFPELAKKGLGKQIKVIQEHLAKMDTNGIRTFMSNGEFAVPETDIVLRLSDVIIETFDIPGWVSATERGITVALDITVTPELRKEGIARDLVNRIQNLRKDLKFEVQDKISVAIAAGEVLVADAVKDFADYIQSETQAVALEISTI
jgi:isoleucyl-tRNA synthetase